MFDAARGLVGIDGAPGIITALSCDVIGRAHTVSCEASSSSPSSTATATAMHIALEPRLAQDTPASRRSLSTSLRTEDNVQDATEEVTLSIKETASEARSSSTPVAALAPAAAAVLLGPAPPASPAPAASGVVSGPGHEWVMRHLITSTNHR